ncbi:centromere protein H (CENP-H)-domain-containing protein [Lineolata rhizophorae]|uniref:Centromere protein H (CENP-H)-domain-containing protein n=1 Tax=Lineolata rhizophorae TaxID=578093 RepID=A0A6A6P355_9PEZI|nr:centromere protein H (CENP-H)-domain-containing protein [Lineolata rhizophorae]
MADDLLADAALRGTDEIADLVKTLRVDTVRLDEREQLILDLHDQLEELKLEQALLKSQRSKATSLGSSNVSDADLDDQIVIAEREVLEARAAYTLRNNIIRNVVITDPVIKAVHESAISTAAERRLGPLIKQRDTLAMLHASQASRLSSISTELLTSRKENRELNEANAQLARTVLDLADSLKPQEISQIEDATLRGELQQVEAKLKESRRVWRVMKSVVSGIIVGSGVNWTMDDDLRELVMDDEDEM